MRAIAFRAPMCRRETAISALGLLEAYLNPHDGRSHMIQLTDHGREVRDRLDAIIRQGVTIAPDRTPRAA